MIPIAAYPTVTSLFTAHDPAAGEDLLISRYSDGSWSYAKRPGRNRTDLTWGPQVELEVERVAS